MGYPAPTIAAPTGKWSSIPMTARPTAPPYLAATLQGLGKYSPGPFLVVWMERSGIHDFAVAH